VNYTGAGTAVNIEKTTVTDQSRPYRMRRRAVSQQQTRQRITESAVELHGTLGPSKTSMTAVAAHAGVRRSTLYRHFPDEAALFDACSAHWAASNPLPDLGVWLTIDDPDQRLQGALAELYSFYTRTEAMLENLLRDEPAIPMVAARFAAFRGYFDAARDALLSGRELRGPSRRRTRAALGHAVAFSTWRSLVREQGLKEGEVIELMCALVDAATAR
jgi:AcrR family transcriptional regulator